MIQGAFHNIEGFGRHGDERLPGQTDEEDQGLWESVCEGPCAHPVFGLHGEDYEGVSIISWSCFLGSLYEGS